MSVEASPSVLDFRPSYGEVPVFGPVSDAMFERLFDIHTEFNPTRHPASPESLRVKAIASFDELARIGDAIESGTGNRWEMAHSLQLDPGLERYGALEIIAASREFLEIARDSLPAHLAKGTWTTQLNLFQNYELLCSMGQLEVANGWHIDAIVEQLRQDLQHTQRITASPTSTRITNSKSVADIDISPLLGKEVTFEALRAFSAAVESLVRVDEIVVPKSGWVAGMDIFRPHAGSSSNNGSLNRGVLRVSA